MLIGYDASRAVRPHPTGTELYAAELLRALAGVDGANRYRLYTNAHAAPEGFGPVPRLSEWRPIPLPRAWTRVRLALEMRRRPPDLLFVPSHVLPPVLPGRSVVTVHGLEHLAAPQAYRPAERRRLDAAAADAVRRADAIVVPSAVTAADMVAHLGAARDRIHVIHHGVRPGFHPRPRDEVDAALARHGLEGAAPYVLFLGSAAPRKDPGTLVRAVVAARRQGAALVLALAGIRAEQAQALRAEARGQGDEGALRVLGYVPDADLPALLTGATAFALPSWYEGFGLPALEAMACGAPCLLSDRGALPEVAGGAALLLPPGDAAAWTHALVHVAGDAGLRASLGERGRQRAAGFRWEDSAREHVALFERVAAAPAGRRGAPAG